MGLNMRRRWLIIGVAVPVLLVAGGGTALYAYDLSRSDIIAEGVSIAGVDVGGLSARDARFRLETRLKPELERPVVAVYGSQRFTLDPAGARVRLDVAAMVKDALEKSRQGTFVGRAWRDLRGERVRATLPPKVAYSGAPVNALIRRIKRALNQPATPAKLQPSPSSVSITPSRDGVAVHPNELRAELLRELVDPHAAHTLTVPAERVPARPSTAQLMKQNSTFITIDRGQFRLRLWKNMRLVRTYVIAVGRSGLETPAGLYDINDREINPSWHVPKSAWAGALAGRVIPPGPDDPIKARWLGFWNGSGIHGTDETWSLGSAASHGCIRMSIPDVEALFPLVPLHTPIYIGD
jgi:lipoprotein-anchoring transpeptidase ErfK/SrfK